MNMILAGCGFNTIGIRDVVGIFEKTLHGICFLLLATSDLNIKNLESLLVTGNNNQEETIS